MDYSPQNDPTLRKSPYFTTKTTPPPPSSSGSSAPSPAPDSPAGSVLKSKSWQQTSSSKAHSQLDPRHHQQRRHGFTFTTPEPTDTAHGASSMSSSRKRTRTGDSTRSITFPDPNSPEATAADLDSGPQKGGHSLRKRARIQYAAEQIDDEVTVPNSTSSASRSKKRFAADDADEDLYGPRPNKRRNTSHSESPSSTRRAPARRNTSNRRYQDGAGLGDVPGFQPVEHGNPWDDLAAMPAPTWQSPQSDPLARANRPSTSYSDPLTAADQAGYPHHLNGNSFDGQTFTSPTDVVAAPSMTGEATSIYDLEQYEDHYNQDTYPPFAPGVGDSLASGSGSPPPAPTHQSHPSSFPHHYHMLDEDSDLYESAIAPQAMFDEAPAAEATPPVDPQLMAAMESNASQHGTSIAEEAPESTAPTPMASADDQTRDRTPSDPESDERQQLDSDPVIKSSATGASTPTTTTTGLAKDSAKSAEDLTQNEPIVQESSLRETLRDEPTVLQPAKVLDPRWCRPQFTPAGRWSHLTPYTNGDYTVYPERKPRPEDDDAASEAPSAADKDSDEKDSGREGEAETSAAENGDSQEAATELPTPAINTPTRGSPAAEVPDLAAINSPMPPGEEPEDRDSSQEPAGKSKHYRFRKLNEAEDFVSALQDYDSMKTVDLYELLDIVNGSLQSWEEEYVRHGKTVDDYENAQRRKAADAKFENRTRDLNQKLANWEEPEFTVKGYKAKEKETMTETKYLQGQDRIQAAAYGFEYDPHPSKIGKQNPAAQQAGRVTTRGRSLRNQPKQTAKATETDVVVGKRQRKPAQVLETTIQDASRSSTPAPTGRGGRRRKNPNAETEETTQDATFTNEANADTEATGPGRRRRAPRGKAIAAQPDEPKADEPAKSTGRRGRPKATTKDDKLASTEKDDAQEESIAQPKRLMVTLKIPKGATIADNGPSPSRRGSSRPSTASSNITMHTADSSYSFRPNRQKRFRDIEDSDGGAQAPAKKRSKNEVAPAIMANDPMDTVEAPTPNSQTYHQNDTSNKQNRIKVVRPGSRGVSNTTDSTPAPTPPPNGPVTASATASRNGTPASQLTTEADNPEYRTMTKSEKMSASMKNRWKNGNMAGAVEKRKATLAMKKAAQAASESNRTGPLAPKQPKARGGKKETTLLPGENAAFLHAQPPPPPHMAHNHHPHQVIQSMPPLSQQPMQHHSHQMPQHAHQQMHPQMSQSMPYGQHEHPQFPPPPQPQYGQHLPPPHHPIQHMPPQHQQPLPPPPPHHQMHQQHHPQGQPHPHYHPHDYPHEYPGAGRPFPQG